MSVPRERNIAVKIRFLGANYHGFQRQQNALSIQEVIEEALFKILGAKTTVFGCSRTDTGVSAYEYVFSFKTENPITTLKLKGALNHFLPNDIAALDTAEAEEDFHARYHTKEKEYEYIVRNTRQKDPFCEGRAFRYGITRLDEELLNKAAAHFVGRHDFSAFCSADDGAKSHVRTITQASVKRHGDDVVFTFRADGFLYNMVRIMVGTLIFVNEGKIAEGDIPKIIESRDRKNAGMTAEPEGLFLKKVIYENDPFESKEVTNG
ncbi:MAG: tRNA pseudouridine(38-40) synthase TruA [Oscillospiraceae bacterium]|nr:tRNA pseudouridine(38-40) synthase TruA [Oscillospiraceae bacterium]